MAANTTKHADTAQPIGMVVDDDALVRETVAEVLEDLCDHVYRASDGLEGLEVLRQHPDICRISMASHSPDRRGGCTPA